MDVIIGGPKGTKNLCEYGPAGKRIGVGEAV